MKEDQRIKFTGEGDQEPGLEPGDVIIILEEKPHSVFKRHGTDLAMTMSISLTEALCGFEKTIKTLDDRTLFLKQEPGGWLLWTFT